MPQLRGQIVHRAHRDGSTSADGSERARRGPGRCWCSTAVCFARLFGTSRCREGGGAPPAVDAAGSPGLRIPRDQRAVLLGGHLDVCVHRRPRARRPSVPVPLEHHFHRPAGLLGQLCACNAPAYRRRICCRSRRPSPCDHFDLASRAECQSLHPLRRRRRLRSACAPRLQRVAFPFHRLAVRLHAAMRDHRRSVGPSS